jgi:hypothetical protein
LLPSPAYIAEHLASRSLEKTSGGICDLERLQKSDGPHTIAVACANRLLKRQLDRTLRGKIVDLIRRRSLDRANDAVQFQDIKID